MINHRAENLSLSLHPHLRSEVAVGGRASYCRPREHWLMFQQTRSLVAVGAVASNSLPLMQVARLAQRLWGRKSVKVSGSK